MNALLLLSACGRIQFAGAPDGPVVDGDPVDAAVACDLTGPFTSLIPISELNSVDTDGGLRLSEDELSAYFHTTRAGQYRVWEAHRTSRSLPFEPPTQMVAATSLWPTVSVDQLTLVYNSNSPDDFHASQRASAFSAFPPATPITELNSGSNESGAIFGRTTQTLYFARLVPEGALFQSAWPPLGVGLESTIAGVNSAAVEQAPVLSRDELTLYFSREPGLNVYVASRSTTADAFSDPAQVPELVSAAGESPTWISPDNCRLYLESSRSGNFDLYVAERKP